MNIIFSPPLVIPRCLLLGAYREVYFKNMSLGQGKEREASGRTICDL